MSRQDKRHRMNRRQFLQSGLLAGAGLFFSAGPKGVTLWQRSSEGKLTAVKQIAAAIPGGTLAPGDVDKYVLPLIKPPAMPPSKILNKQDLYKIAVRQFSQRILSPPHPETPVWSYGSVDFPGTVAEGGTFNYPAFTIEANWNRRVISWSMQTATSCRTCCPSTRRCTGPTHRAARTGATRVLPSRQRLDATRARCRS
jgi:hypothetical protein